MHVQFFNQKLGSLLSLTDDLAGHYEDLRIKEKLLHILWNQTAEAISITIDGIPVKVEPQQIITTTYLQQVRYQDAKGIMSWSFNREFYCISDHDNEVSCNGIIFLGTQTLPIISLNEEQQRKIELLYAVFVDEFGTRDNIQEEMLVMLLKRMIILITRLAKEQNVSAEVNDEQLDVIRHFNVLVDLHYKTYKLVADYADMLHRSPKTLSNLFAKYGEKSPLQIIHERIVLEAKRLLLYTDFTAKEIAYELGYRDVAAFNKLIKKHLGMAPSEYRKTAKIGT
ncbi:MAG TPA: AraC family transcriptional regulator [Cytophagales bacterium]|nr:AraC family transcriptional regulator [Cytophagales bacterium]HAA23967.1 AraC family transcriptional regulator [Cytophagales bacterium]HAP58369.1 AraC family transcriptional regulator [Cytophagales bacterium]